MEDTDNRKRDVAQIKILASSKEAPENYDSDAYTRVPNKKKERTGVLPTHKHQGKNNPNNSGDQRYCVL